MRRPPRLSRQPCLLILMGSGRLVQTALAGRPVAAPVGYSRAGQHPRESFPCGGAYRVVPCLGIISASELFAPARLWLFSLFPTHEKQDARQQKNINDKGYGQPGEPLYKNTPAITKARYDNKTTHPCQVAGIPHPKPYFMAWNQISLSLPLMTLSLASAKRPCTGADKTQRHRRPRARPGSTGSFATVIPYGSAPRYKRPCRPATLAQPAGPGRHRISSEAPGPAAPSLKHDSCP